VAVNEFADEPAKLSMARETPTEQSTKASKTRPMKIPDSEGKFLFITNFLLLLQIETHSINGRIRDAISVESFSMS
jgi:hypothetical protein